jgi:dTDP-4-amino-4,6-dideoxygalactose transaminase
MMEVPPTASLPLGWRDLWGPDPPPLAERAATFLDLPQVQVECSGTACLIVALMALRAMSPRRTVIIPAFTCPLVPLAVAHCGLRVQLCDLAADHFDMDHRMLARLCNDDTLAVVPTHLAGRVANVARARAHARAAGAWVIEDAAQALGARREGICVGTLADIGFFSLAVGKGLTTYEGGILCSGDPALRTAMRRASERIIRANGWLELGRSVQLLGYSACYRPRWLRFVYGAPLRRALRRGRLAEAAGDLVSQPIPLHRLGRWRGSVAARAFDRLPEFQAELAAFARARRARLQSIDGLKVFGDPHGTDGTWPCLLVLMPSEAARDAALAHLWPAGVGASRLFVHALPDYEFLAAVVPPAQATQARSFAARTLTLSNSPWLGDAQFESIVRILGCAVNSESRMDAASCPSSR